MGGYDTASARSADGTTIGYRRFGHGPAVILLHGGMQAAQDYTKLAGTLPRTQRVTFAGLGHGGPDNDGEPERVGATLRTFFQD